MKETTIEDVLSKAESWHAQGMSWHIHMLTPSCVFNERTDKHAFVLENGTLGEAYVVYSDEPHTEADQKLLFMIHGDDILDEEKGATDSSNLKMQIIIEKARRLNEAGLPWHHHMLFPDCVFNKHEGKWSIAFESEADGEFLEVLYDEEPVDDLRRIEILFFEKEG